MEKDDKGKMQIVPIGWQPICSKEMPYELTVSFLLDAEKPGYPKPLKLQEQHKALFPLDKLLNEESGKGIAEWAKGSNAKAEKPQEQKNRERLEILIAEKKLNRDRVKECLVHIGGIPIPTGDEKASMKQLPDNRVKQILDKWESFVNTFNEWAKA